MGKKKQVFSYHLSPITYLPSRHSHPCSVLFDLLRRRLRDGQNAIVCDDSPAELDLKGAQIVIAKECQVKGVSGTLFRQSCKKRLLIDAHPVERDDLVAG